VLFHDDQRTDTVYFKTYPENEWPLMSLRTNREQHSCLNQIRQTILVLSNVYNVIGPDTTNYFSIIKCV
jgi:hypothetical protein